MQDYSDFHHVVQDMMGDFGTPGLLLRPREAEYDPDTGTAEAGVDELPITCILMDLTLQSNGAGTREKTLIRDGDKVLYVQPADGLGTVLAAVDSATDKVVVGGVTYDVVTTKSLDPTASDPILFELYVRR